MLLIFSCLTFAPAPLLAHPWGGLVVDHKGHIYFAFTSPLVDDNHYASVWQINSQQELAEALKSSHSPSDIVVARTPNRNIYAAERNNAGYGFQARLWQIKETNKKLVIKPTTSEQAFHIQAYTVTDDETVVFARNNKLYQRNSANDIRPLKTKHTFTRIDDLAWGPNNSLYILDRGSIKILEKNGTVETLVTDLKKENPEDLPFTGANILFDLAVDAQSNVYVAYYGNRRILKITATGNVSDFLLSRPWSPHGIDVYNGEVYILESTSHSASWWKFWEKSITIPRIRKVDTTGNVSTIFEYQSNE